MHELGTLLTVVDTVDEIIEDNGLTDVESITLEIGEVSGILPDFLYKCWDFARGKSRYSKRAELIVNMLPAVTRCNSCGGEYETVRHGKVCPECGSSDTVLVCGNEYNIGEVVAS